jgi:hypothetical protein
VIIFSPNFPHFPQLFPICPKSPPSFPYFSHFWRDSQQNRSVRLQANTVIASDASRRAEAFTDVDVNLSGQAARAFEPAPAQNGHAPPAQVPAPPCLLRA